MTDRLIADIAATSVVLTGCLFLWKLSTRWKLRFGTFGSALIRGPAYRVLLVLVVIGILLICLVPEAAMVLPAIDAVGLDIVTFLVALELRHYLASLAVLVGIPTSAAVCLRAAARQMNPVRWLYACMWSMIWLRTAGIR